MAVPEAFFKIVIDVTREGGLRTLAFLVPQEVDRNTPYREYLTSIDRIEGVTGWDFLSLLEDAVEAELESGVAVRVW